jgi:hypothetical protein
MGLQWAIAERTKKFDDCIEKERDVQLVLLLLTAAILRDR